jgi:hypothetical protein
VTRRRIRAAVAALLAVVLLVSCNSARSAEDPVTIPVLGVTHTQFSLDPWNPPSRVASGEKVLSAAPQVQNQNIMGWGADNPEPSPGDYNWSSLDRRMALIERTQGTPVITLAGAPDWMKGGERGKTDWSRINAAPSRDHFGDFADLAAAVAQRYPKVRYFQVWSELKGFWDEDRQRWDAAAYTDLYNAVHDAVKAVRPDAKIGGPYVVMDTWSGMAGNVKRSPLTGPWGMVDGRTTDVITYWNGHKHGADFVVVDGSTATKDRGLTTDPFTATAMFTAVTRWVAAETGLPVWWAEFYPDRGTEQSAGGARQTAVTLDAVARMAEGGAARMLLWQPQASEDFRYSALWTSPDAGAVQPTSLAAPWAWLCRVLGQHNVRITRENGLLGFVSSGGTMWVNLTDRGKTPPGTDEVLPPYGVSVPDRT